MIETLLPDCGLSKHIVNQDNQISPSYSAGGFRIQKDNTDRLDAGSDEQGSGLESIFVTQFSLGCMISTMRAWLFAA